MREVRDSWAAGHDGGDLRRGRQALHGVPEVPRGAGEDRADGAEGREAAGTHTGRLEELEAVNLIRETRRAAADKAEVELIRTTLAATGWNVSAAARILGLDRCNLRRSIRRFGLRGEREETT